MPQSPPILHKPVIVEADVLQAMAAGMNTLRVGRRALLTPLAIDTARAKGVTIEQVDDSSSKAARITAHPQFIAIGSDHEGYALKERIKIFLAGEGWSIRDLGVVSSSQQGDSRGIACRVAKEVAAGYCVWGVVIDATGILPSVVANRVSGIVAVTCHDTFTSTVARSRFGANLLCLGGNIVGQQLAVEIVKVWMTAHPVCLPGSSLPDLPDVVECQIRIDDLDCL
jgi:RpiB/LacA/LacB family sugar-phosphate isomerase